MVPVQVMLTGVPLRAGLFTITGCLVTAMGVSWKQPWLPRSAFSGQQDGTKAPGGHPQVQVFLYAHPPLFRRAFVGRRNSSLEDAGLDSEGSNPLHSMQARVSVVDPLPLIRVRMETPPTSVAPQIEQKAVPSSDSSSEIAAAAPKSQEANAPIEPIRASALKGQILSWWLSISNAGTLCCLMVQLSKHWEVLCDV